MADGLPTDCGAIPVSRRFVTHNGSIAPAVRERFAAQAPVLSEELQGLADHPVSHSRRSEPVGAAPCQAHNGV